MRHYEAAYIHYEGQVTPGGVHHCLEAGSVLLWARSKLGKQARSQQALGAQLQLYVDMVQRDSFPATLLQQRRAVLLPTQMRKPGCNGTARLPCSWANSAHV